ncbi:MAG: PLP-dependent aminotransferase family protein [Burkholderiaceae bacterium]|nr:PLP-dependent aminotransferase family protein [Burkholderiaceae bacterium]
MSTTDAGTPDFAPSVWRLKRDDRQTLVAQVAGNFIERMNSGELRIGERVASIRKLASEAGIGFSTAVEAYEVLVAQGYLEARRGSGYYVKSRNPAAGLRPAGLLPPKRLVDTTWLIRSLRDDRPSRNMPGSGMLPRAWLDEGMIAAALRALGRQQLQTILRYGEPLGFLPLRSQLALKLAEIHIGAAAQQILLTSGITHALDIVAHEFLHPGDTVFVDDPGWFVMFGRLKALGAKVVGIPWTADGPDLARANALASVHRPKLYVINPILHNPTGGTISAAKAHELLKQAERHNYLIVENDAFADLAPPGTTRLATLDQLQRVIYVSGFSKTLAAGLRVGFIACNERMTGALADQKMLGALTSSEMNERVVHRILSEGHYRKHVAKLRARLDATRAGAIRNIESIGLRVPETSCDGMFVWADAGVDTSALAQRALAQDFVLAPGRVFTPDLRPSTWMRINISACSHPSVLAMLKSELNSSR